MLTGSDANMVLEPLYSNKHNSDNMNTFAPRVLTPGDFSGVCVSAPVIEKAILGSQIYRKRHDDGTLFPSLTCGFDEAKLDEDLLVHNYTGQCPVQTFEINPVKGCNVGCAYCLVNDGMHESPVIYNNYHQLVEKQMIVIVNNR